MILCKLCQLEEEKEVFGKSHQIALREEIYIHTEITFCKHDSSIVFCSDLRLVKHTPRDQHTTCDRITESEIIRLAETHGE